MWEIALLVLAALTIVLWLYLNALATLLVLIDPYWPRITRFGHLIMIWLFPIVGAMMKLHFVRQHSPELIDRLWIPWPARAAVEGRQFGGKRREGASEKFWGAGWRDGDGGGDVGDGD